MVWEGGRIREFLARRSGAPGRGVDLRGARGAQVGDRNRQVNAGTYIEQVTYAAAEPVESPALVGVLPPVADCYQARGDARLDLAARLGAGQTAVVTQVLSGLGGIGKTQLAARFAHARWAARAVDLLVWVTASSREAVLSGYAAAARRVDGGARPGEDGGGRGGRGGVGGPVSGLAGGHRPALADGLRRRRSGGSARAVAPAAAPGRW